MYLLLNDGVTDPPYCTPSLHTARSLYMQDDNCLGALQCTSVSHYVLLDNLRTAW